MHPRCRTREHVIAKGICLYCEHLIVDGVAVPWDGCDDDCRDTFMDEVDA